LAKADGPDTIQTAIAKARTVIGNLAPRRIGETIDVLLFVFPCRLVPEKSRPRPGILFGRNHHPIILFTIPIAETAHEHRAFFRVLLGMTAGHC
jgi:hypothetical protein